jgi:isocitrate/isopropylmalate dehydrogenase
MTTGTFPLRKTSRAVAIVVYLVMSSSTIRSSEKVYKIAAIPGDGIGVEITEAAIQVLQKLADVSRKFKFDFETFDWNSKRYKEKGHYIPPDGIDQLKKFDAIYFGAVGWPGMHSNFFSKLNRSFWLTKVHRCSRSYLPMGPHAPTSQLPHPVCERPTNTHITRDKITSR